MFNQCNLRAITDHSQSFVRAGDMLTKVLTFPTIVFVLLCNNVRLSTELSLYQNENNDNGYCSADPEIQRKRRVPVCVLPVDSVRTDGPYHIGADANFLDELPDWFDPDLAAIGQKFARENAFGLYYAMYLTIMFTVIDPEARKVLINNGHVTSPEGAALRYLTNNLQVALWFQDTIRRENGSSSNFVQSLHAVRARHATAAHKAAVNDTFLRSTISIPEPPKGHNPENIDFRIWNAFEADLKASKKLSKLAEAARKENSNDRHNGTKYLMNQFGMSVVLFLHVGLPVWVPEQVMLPHPTNKELEGLLHLWAFIGNAVGVKDEYNICFQPDIPTARNYMKTFFYKNMVPFLFELDYEGKVLVEYIFKGINNIFFRGKNDIMYNTNNMVDIVLLRLLEDILKIPAHHMRSVLNPFELASHATLQHLIRGHQGVGHKMYSAIGSNIVLRLLRITGKVKLGLDPANHKDIAEKAFV